MTSRILISGALLGLSLSALKALEVLYLQDRIQLDVYLGIVAVFCVVIGIYAGMKIKRVQKHRAASLPASLRATKPVIGRFNLATAEALSKRELEVLQYIAAGHSNEEIADRLYVSVNTIKTHTSNIYNKLDVKRRTQAVKKARQAQLIA